MLPPDLHLDEIELKAHVAPPELDVIAIMPSATMNSMIPSCEGCYRCRGGTFAIPTTTISFFDMFLIAKINIKDFDQHEVRIFRSRINVITVVCETRNNLNHRNYERSLEIPPHYNPEQARSMWESTKVLSIIVPRY